MGSSRPVSPRSRTNATSSSRWTAGQGNRQPLRQVLQPDADGQRHRAGVSATETNPGREAFRQVVEGYGEDEQPDTSERRLRSLAPLKKVFILYALVELRQEEDAERDSDGCNGGRDHASAKLIVRNFDRGDG